MIGESKPADRATGATDIGPLDNRCYGCQVAELYNQERPHQALEGRYPAQVYQPSRRPYTGLSDLEYPFHDRTITVTTCGRICFGRRKINLSHVFAGQNVGVKEVADKIWLVSFMHYDLGFFDHETGRVECAPNPFGAKLLPMSPEENGYHVPG
jgi:putative transposase